MACVIGVLLMRQRRMQRSMHARLQKSLAQAQRAEAASKAASRSKSQFLANISHEMKTPMGGIVGMASLLEEMIEDPTQRRHLATIKACSDNLNVLINDLLQLGRIESGVVKINPVEASVTELIEVTRETFSPTAKAKGLEIDVTVSRDVPERVYVDPVRLAQILNNLTANAVNFTLEGRVWIRADFRPGIGSYGDLVLEVGDSGIGISEEQQELVFEPFHRIGGAGPLDPSGSGLGLAICRKLARLMGGSIRLSSSCGEGSVFTCILPVRN